MLQPTALARVQYWQQARLYIGWWSYWDTAALQLIIRQFDFYSSEGIIIRAIKTPKKEKTKMKI